MKQLDQRNVVELRREIEAAISAGISKVLDTPLHVRFHSSKIFHETLVPEGDKFVIHVEVEVHPKVEKPPA